MSLAQFRTLIVHSMWKLHGTLGGKRKASLNRNMELVKVEIIVIFEKELFA